MCYLYLLLFSCSVMSNALQPHGLQHARLPCSSLSPEVCSNSCSLIFILINCKIICWWAFVKRRTDEGSGKTNCISVCVCAVCSVTADSVTPRTDYSLPGSSRLLEFARQEFWSGLSFPTPGDLPNPGIEPLSLASPALAGEFIYSQT